MKREIVKNNIIKTTTKYILLGSLTFNGYYQVYADQNISSAFKLTYLDGDSLEYDKDQKIDAGTTAKESAEKNAQSKKDSKKSLTAEEKKSVETTTAPENNKATTDTDNSEAEVESDTTLMSDPNSLEQTFYDPYEGYNRFMYSVNKNIDKYIIKTPAQLYAWLMPTPVRYFVTNFFENMFDMHVFVNDFLQGEFSAGAKTLTRFTLNSTFGIFGLLDVAKDAGYPHHINDFGITFAKWGMEESPYFVIPVLGPSTVRDAAGTGLTAATTVLYYYLPDEYSIGLTVTYMIDKRANLLSLEKIIDTVSDDEYIFVRNAYLTYRNSLIKGERPNRKQEQNEQGLIEDIMLKNDLADDEFEDLDDLELAPLDDDNKTAQPISSESASPEQEERAKKVHDSHSRIKTIEETKESAKSSITNSSETNSSSQDKQKNSKE